MSTNILKEYINLYKQYRNEHGDNTVLLFQIGKFYEIYTVQEKTKVIGNAEEISNKLEIKLARKDSGKEFSVVNPYFTGFPLMSAVKYINKLIKNDYIVVVYDQEPSEDKDNIKRTLQGIYTKAITPLDSDFDIDENYLYVGVVSDKKGLYKYGYTLFNNKTNEVIVNELNNISYKDLVQERHNLESMYNIEQKVEKTSDVLDQKYSDEEYCNALIREVYKNVNFGLLSPIQYLFNKTVNFELIQSLCLFFDLIYKYNSTLLTNISKPILTCTKTDKLKLHLNTIKQLHLKELKDYVINCVTSVGKRKAMSLLYEPYSDVTRIQDTMIFTQQIQPIYKNIIAHLKNLKDITKIHRELTSYSIKIDQIEVKIIDNYNIVLDVLNLIDEESVIFRDLSKEKIKSTISEMISDVTDNLSNGVFLDTSNWKTDEIKELENKKKKLTEEFEIEKNKYSKYDVNGFLKLEVGGLGSTEYYYKITSSRYSQNVKLKRAIEDDKLIVQQQKSNLKIVSPKLNQKWNELELLTCELDRKVAEVFKLFLKYYTNKYHQCFDVIKALVETVDIAVMNNVNHFKWNYNSVEFNVDLCIKDLRHPIIERINNNTDYIANDMVFSDKEKGIVLYGINSSGKSSLIRALGISIIMAQCGFYVPCSEFKMGEPYKNIMCQVDLQDDIFKGNSSFITEAIGIKYMLNIMDKNERSIVIADELTRGTENKSAIAIFGATVKRLLSYEKCHFIFTTHLHEISQLNTLQTDIQQEHLRIYHIDVNRDENTSEFIFKRKLQRGPINPLYGLEIVKSIIGEKIFDPFVIEAEAIRKELCGEKDELISNTRSRYNKRKIVNKCEVCGYKPSKKTDLPLDTHHVKFQCTANETGFIDTIHKHTKSNLVVLCKECHTKVHKNEIEIQGYVQTTENTKIFFKSNL